MTSGAGGTLRQQEYIIKKERRRDRRFEGRIAVRTEEGAKKGPQILAGSKCELEKARARDRSPWGRIAVRAKEGMEKGRPQDLRQDRSIRKE